MHILIPESQLISITEKSDYETVPAPSIIYKGEWLYASLSRISSLLEKIYYCYENDSIVAAFGINVDSNLEIKSKQQIRSKIAVIESQRIFPYDITVGEEILNSMQLKDRSYDLSTINSILREYSISTDQFCNSLSTKDRILLDIIIAVESEVSVVILNAVASLLPFSSRERILNFLHYRSFTNGLSVIIATKNNEIKSKYLGRDIS